MASTDVFTISALIVLIMGAVCFYLYTRIKQVEKKVALVEGILLDLKTATEASFMDFPAASSYMFAKDIGADDDNFETTGDDEDNEPLEEAPFGGHVEDFDESSGTGGIEILEESAPADTVHVTKIASAAEQSEANTVGVTDDSVKTIKPDSVTNNLELLNVKELNAIAKSKNIPVTKTMKKQQIIDLINSFTTGTITETVAEPMEDTFAADSDLLGGGSSLGGAPY